MNSLSAKSLSTQRILSIDAFRGITILVMIFVNELSAVQGIPLWMKHMPADADAMTFVDAVFPAFLFIVGMSIPFAINNRIMKGDTILTVQKHVLIRAAGLLVLGVFMVNAEGGFNQEAMPISIYLWSILFYVAVILIWNVYKPEQRKIALILRLTGIVMLIILAFSYRGEDGINHITPQWWGILGLIGWAYLISSILYQLCKGNVIVLLVMIAVCIGYYAAGQETMLQQSDWGILFTQGGHAALVSIVLCGIVLSMIFFSRQTIKISRRFIEGFAFTAALFIAGFILRPYYHISKIYATPTWCFYSAGFCCLIFMFLYWLIDLKKINAWTSFFKPAATNPLLTYIIPFIVYAVMKYVNLSLPGIFYQGIMGILWSAAYAVLVMAVVIWLNKIHVRLQL